MAELGGLGAGQGHGYGGGVGISGRPSPDFSKRKSPFKAGKIDPYGGKYRPIMSRFDILSRGLYYSGKLVTAPMSVPGLLGLPDTVKGLQRTKAEATYAGYRTTAPGGTVGVSGQARYPTAPKTLAPTPEFIPSPPVSLAPPLTAVKEAKPVVIPEPVIEPAVEIAKRRKPSLTRTIRTGPFGVLSRPQTEKKSLLGQGGVY